MIDHPTNQATALYRRSGPFTTIYLPAPSARSDAAELRQDDERRKRHSRR